MEARMLFAILNAGIVYGLLWLFERKKRELDDFHVSKAAVVPAFIYLGLSVAVLVFQLGPIASLIALAAFIIALFWMLWKNVKLPPSRAAAYSVAVLVINVGIFTLLAYKIH
jgi:4-hydroxybenzoate polyprenyltransferase